MEARQIIAYLLLAGIIVALIVAYRFATRDHRAHNRAHKAADRHRRQRIEENADRP